METVTGKPVESSKGRSGNRRGSMSSAPPLGADRAVSPSMLSSDMSDAGVRLGALTLESSPTASRYTPPHTRRGLGDPDFAKAVRDPAPGSPNFQLGSKPSGDVFSSPPKPVVPEEEQARPSTTPHNERFRLALQAVANEDNATNSPIQGLRYRSSNLSSRHQVGGVDAQGVYPPSACVFVANLPEPKDDRSLEAAVTREFSKYGTVFVKIRRDVHHMPFAFCQYTKDEDARNAMIQGKGTLVYGRACRTEMVKANRAFIIYKRQGKDITLEEAREALDPHGALSKIEYLHPQLRNMLGLPMTVVVEFAMFDPLRDVHAAFRHNEEFRVDTFDLKKNMHANRNDVDEAFLNQYEVDRRSVFIGSLPPHITEDDLMDLFADIGPILDIQLVKKPTSGIGSRVFAFIEFEQPNMPELAVQRFNDTSFDGVKLRVERKVVKEHTPRRVRSQYLGHKSPTGNALVTSTPKTPEARFAVSPSHKSGGERSFSMAAPAPPTWGWMYGAPAFNGSNYMATPPSPYGPQTSHGTIPMTPQGTPGAISTYPYYGGYWPGMTYVPDPMAAMGYYPYTSPTAPVAQADNGLGSPYEGGVATNEGAANDGRPKEKA